MFVEIGGGDPSEFDKLDKNFLSYFQDLFIVCVHRILVGKGIKSLCFMVGRPFGVEQRLFEFYEIPFGGIPRL
jgi:hypothetical protein